MNFVKKFQIFGLLIILAVLLVACTKDNSIDLSLAKTYAAQTQAAMSIDTTEPTLPEPTEAETTAPTATPELVIEPSGPTNFPENINPLTGLPVSDPSILDRRPVLVKVANYPVNGRPHAGLSSADIVFEYYIGTGGNRFNALYYGQNADMIGPVRSGRMIDPYLTSLFEGIQGFEGAYIDIYEHIVEILGNRAISGKDICPGICDDGRGLVISVFADSEALTDYSTKRGVENHRYVLEGMAFDPQPPQGGEDAELMNIQFARVNPSEWRYDEESGKYLQWIDNETGQVIDLIPLVDRVNDQQLAFSNVIVLFAEHDEIAPTWHDIFMWDNFSGERAIVFRDGKAFDIEWKTPSRTQPIQFVDETGDIFRLKPGNSWIIIMGLNSNVITEDDNWTFEFYMP